MKIVAFDPGETTGFVIIDIETKKLIDFGVFECREAHPYIRLILRAAIRDSSPCIIVFELFQIRSGHVGGAQKDVKASQVIGIIKANASDFDCEVVGQPPTVRLRITNDVLKDIGYDLKKIKSPHIRDALRHAVRWMRKNNEKWHEELKLKEARRKGLI